MCRSCEVIYLVGVILELNADIDSLLCFPGVQQQHGAVHVSSTCCCYMVQGEEALL